MADVQGTYDDRFEDLAAELSRQLDSGEELGASIALTLGGEMVVDIWGGHADEAQTTPWERDTITNVWSTTKTMTNLCALMLVDRGLLDVHEKVAHYWPEFAANGKQDIEVRHLLSHTSGVSAWDPPFTIDDLYDYDGACAHLAAQAPWWEPGTASGYHALNQGHLVGEVVRRIDGRSLGTFFREEVAEPLGADFHIGLPESEFGRVSNVVPPPPLDIAALGLAPDDLMIRTLSSPPADATNAWTTAWRTAEIGAANGHGNARSVARIQSVVTNGGEVDGVRLLSPETIDLIFEEQSHGPDLVLKVPLRFGVGYGLPVPESLPGLPDGKRCFWGGWGGSVIVNDVEEQMTIAYMMNRMGPGVLGSDRANAYLSSVYSAVHA